MQVRLFIHLAKQIYPNNVKYFQQAYQMATAEPFSYLFIDLTPHMSTPDEKNALKVWHISERQTLRYRTTKFKTVNNLSLMIV